MRRGWNWDVSRGRRTTSVCERRQVSVIVSKRRWWRSLTHLIAPNRTEPNQQLPLLALAMTNESNVRSSRVVVAQAAVACRRQKAPPVPSAAILRSHTAPFPSHSHPCPLPASTSKSWKPRKLPSQQNGKCRPQKFFPQNLGQLKLKLKLMPTPNPKTEQRQNPWMWGGGGVWGCDGCRRNCQEEK